MILKKYLCLLYCLLLLSACQPTEVQSSSTSITSPNATSIAVPATTKPSFPIQRVRPLASADAYPPTSIQIPDINLATSVSPMTWQIDVRDDKRTTYWEIPYTEAGWHPNSAKVGAEGNIVISGYQHEGEAVFAPLSIGLTKLGQLVLLEAENGQRFVYQISKISEPLLAKNAQPEEQAIAQSYLDNTDTAQLILITGWPDFTTTHRIFTIAEFVGISER